MKHRLFAGLAALAILVPALAQAADPVTIDGKTGDINWIRRPSLLQISSVAEDKSASEGSATIECEILASARTGNCTVTAEHGRNLGQAAIGVLALYKASSKDSAGASVVGRRVRFALALGRPSLH